MDSFELNKILGAILGLAWANLDPASYHALVEHPLLVGGPIGEMHVDAEGHAHRILTVHFLVNDILMALFFAIAGKEVWEAVALRTGSLRGRKALTPLIATAGGMIGPAGVYLAGALMLTAAFSLKLDHGRWWLALGGIASVIFGIVLLIAPVVGAVVLTWWLGAYAIVFGVFLLVLAFKLHGKKEERETKRPATRAAKKA